MTNVSEKIAIYLNKTSEKFFKNIAMFTKIYIE